MLLTFTSMSPVLVLFLGVSLRDRAALPSPLRGLDPSGGHPSRLRSLRSLRVPCPAARFAHRRLHRLRRGALLRRCGASAFVSSSRRRFAFAKPPGSRAESRPLSRRRGCPPVPPPGPLPPTFGTSNWVFSTPFGGSALTPDAPMVPGAACACLKYPWSAHETPRDPTQSPNRRHRPGETTRIE